MSLCTSGPANFQTQETPAPPPDASRKLTVSGDGPLVAGVALMAGLGSMQPPPPPPLLVATSAALTGNTDVAVTLRSLPTMNEMSGVITWKRQTSVTVARSPRPILLLSPSTSA